MTKGLAAATMLAATVVAAVCMPAAEATERTPRIPVIGFADPIAGGGRLPVGAPATVPVMAGTNSVGLSWSGDADLLLRSHGPQGWSAWTPLESESDHGPDGATDSRSIVGPVWTGPDTTAVEVLAAGHDATDLVVRTSGAVDEPLRVVGLEPAVTGRVHTVQPTSAWQSPGWSWTNCPEGPEATRPVEAVVVHHTVTTTDYAPEQVDDILRSIHRFHTRTRGWCDVAYQFLVDRFGRIWEGRSGGITLPIEGGHARGFNRATTGVAVIGDLDHENLPQAALDALTLLTAWKAVANDFDPRGSVHRISGGSTSLPAGTPIELPRVSGHRDISRTSCPGRHGYEWLTAIRDDAAHRLAAPAPFAFGTTGDVPLIGDWDGDGSTGVAVYRPGEFHLRAGLSGGPAQGVVRFGILGDQPLAGDWDGDGTDTLGVERDGEFHLLSANRTPDPLRLLSGDRTVRPAVPAGFPIETATPLRGDWDGDGIDTLGYAADGEVVLYADPDARRVARRDRVGGPGDAVVVADWDTDGIDDLLVVHGGVLYVPSRAIDGLLPAHRLAPGHRVFSIDWTGLGLPTLLTVSPDLHWDPTTPIGR